MSGCVRSNGGIIRLTLEVGSRHVATILHVLFSFFEWNITGVKRRDGGTLRGVGGHGCRIRLRVLHGGVRPVGRRPGKLGHSGVLNRRTRELLLEMALQLQTERVSSRVILRQKGLEGRRPMGSVRG